MMRGKFLFLPLLLILSILFCGCSKIKRENNNGLNAGIIRIDITPPIGYPVHKVPSDGVLDPVEVKTAVLSQGDIEIALISVDLFYVPLDLSDHVRKIVYEKTGIPVANICVAATHTHTDPTCYEEVSDYINKVNSGNLTEADKESYPAQLIDRLVNSVLHARANRQPVNLKSGIIEVEGVVFNRRHLKKDGLVVMNGGFLNPDIVRSVGPVDPDLGVLLFSSKSEDTPFASFSTFGMQLATIGASKKFSSDYPHFIEKRLQEELGDGFVSIFGEGPSGDTNHWDITKAGPQIGYEVATKPVGNKIGEVMLQGLAGLTENEASLAVASKVLDVPLQMYSDLDLEWAKGLSDPSASAILKARARKIVTLEELRKRYGENLPMEIQVFRVAGNTAIVALPGQFFVELGIAIKEASPFETTLVVTLANSHEETIPLRKAYTEGSYEIVYSLVESGGGEMMVDTAIKMLNELKK